MQYYTKQQLQGASRYVDKVLIGNWNEERSVAESRDTLGAFHPGGRNTALAGHKCRELERTLLAPEALTVSKPDGLLRYGDVVQLAHVADDATLCLDARKGDAAAPLQAGVASASASHRSPVVRNTFVPLRHRPFAPDISTSAPPDDVVRFGQKFHLACTHTFPVHPSRTPPLYLHSKAATATQEPTSSISGRQNAAFSRLCNYDSVFRFAPPDPSLRVCSEGSPVHPGRAVCLEHCATGALLCADAETRVGRFGPEAVVTFHAHRPAEKKAMLVHERRGELAATAAPLRAAKNCFRVVIGDAEGRPWQLPDFTDQARSVVATLAQEVSATQGSCVPAFQRLLKLDRVGTGHVHMNDVTIALQCCGGHVGEEDAQVLATHFATGQQDMVDVRALATLLLECGESAQG